jgi:hypothetical protein
LDADSWLETTTVLRAASATTRIAYFEELYELFSEKLMRTPLYRVPASAKSPADLPSTFVTRMRSISCADVIQAGVIILNQTVILASSIFDRQSLFVRAAFRHVLEL